MKIRVMFRRPLFFSFFCILLFCGSLFLSADDRTENLDLFVVLDKSLSMEEEISTVKQYVVESLVDEILIPGDFFVLIQFFGEAQVVIATSIEDQGQKNSIMEDVRAIQADGSFTDIGNALDALRAAIETYRHEEHREYLLLITDGKQEAPPQSKYYSPDGTFNHAFLENTKEIQKEGWSIHVLGIGAGSAAKDIAEELAGVYTETSEDPTVEELESKTKDLFGTITLAGTLYVHPVDAAGESRLVFSLAAAGWSESQTVTIESITFNSGYAV